MKLPLLLLLAGISVATSASAQEVIRADEIEKQMGLTPTAPAGKPKTRSFRPGAAIEVATKAAGRVIQRAAAASGATLKTLKTLKTRGVSVVEVEGNGNRVSVPVVENAQATFKNILFEKDSTRLADAASAAQIAEIADVMLKYPGLSFVVEGHTCDLGSDAHNERLSVARAAAVEASLCHAGVRPEQIVALGFGESDPAAAVSAQAPASDSWAEARRSQNRRVVIRLQAPAGGSY